VDGGRPNPTPSCSSPPLSSREAADEVLLVYGHELRDKRLEVDDGLLPLLQAVLVVRRPPRHLVLQLCVQLAVLIITSAGMQFTMSSCGRDVAPVGRSLDCQPRPELNLRLAHIIGSRSSRVALAPVQRAPSRGDTRGCVGSLGGIHGGARKERQYMVPVTTFDPSGGPAI